MNTPSTVADTLDAAADLISSPDKWTKGSYARDMFGGKLGDGRNVSAECWCTIGALEHVSGGLVGKELTDPIYAALGLTCHASIVDWNDYPDTTHDEVVTTLRKAANLARGEVQP